MKPFRTVRQIIPAQSLQMGKTLVKQPLPTNSIQRISPFLLLHHFGAEVEPGRDPLGVGAHPHRGFEPVTFLFSGGIEHRDSRGNHGLLEAGDVQWMTAGMGIVHSEMASPAFLDKGGKMEGIQLWVNLPKAHKMVQPRYQDMKGSDFPVIQSADGKFKLKLVTGSLDGQKGPAKTYTPVMAMFGDFKTGGRFEIPIAPGHNCMLYILDGKLKADGFGMVEKEQLIWYKNDGDAIAIEGLTDGRLLLLSGEPIDEPLAQHGPFVMNTQTEIMEAMRDYQMGKMGVLVKD